MINDWSSSVPPDIYSFTPFIYNITLHGDQVELLIPSNQGNWIDCSKTNAENSIEFNHLLRINFIFVFKILFHYVQKHSI